VTTGNEGVAALDAHRQDIDRIDRTIVALIAERMRIGLVLGELKKAASEPFRSPVREAAVIARVREAAAGPLSPASAERIFAAIIEETVACQARPGAPDRG
jgi:isochorismate pyruvate lyase